MAQKYVNTHDLSLSVAVFLAHDVYDHNDDPYHFSTTTLIKPVRQVVLANRVEAKDAVIDISQNIASCVGSAIHDGIERSWLSSHKEALTALGIPDRVVKKVVVNPEPDQDTSDVIPVYLERRTTKQVGKYSVSGKFDFVGEGRLEDFKTTSTYTAMSGSNDKNYALQGSIYRWLNPDIITQDQMMIQFIFTDWSAVRAKSDPKYPQKRIMARPIALMSVSQTDAYVRNKLAQFEQYWHAPEETIPHCNDEDLWRTDPVFKYYKNPEKTSRSTKNFDTHQEALIRLSQDGNVGIIKETPGQVKACHYCNAFTVCTQKDALIAAGELII